MFLSLFGVKLMHLESPGDSCNSIQRSRKELPMSNRCEMCGKAPRVGNNVSHANNKTKRVWYPNLQQVRHVGKDGSVRRIRVCTRCIRTGLVVKPA